MALLWFMVTPEPSTGIDSVRGAETSLPPKNALAVHTAYAELVARRKACSCCDGLENPSRCGGGTFDRDQIGPWTLWQGNLHAKCMVVGQDWGDTNYFLNNKGREAHNNPTNTTLRKLLKIAGLSIDAPSTEKSGEDLVFFTNAILCLKQGGLQAAVDPAWFANCSKLFLKPTIDLIKPNVVVTLGERAYRAVCLAYGMRPQTFRSAVEGEPTQLPSGPLLLPVYHCGARILNTHRPLSIQESDWARVGRVLSIKVPA